MVRKLPFSTVNRSAAIKYLEKADRFKADAERMLELADDFSGNGVAVLCVHAAIAYGDAVTILAASKKSKSGDHQDAAALMASVVPIQSAEDKTALKSFEMILKRKDIVSYMDELVGTEQAADLLKKLTIFAQWARKTIEDLRTRQPLV